MLVLLGGFVLGLDFVVAFLVLALGLLLLLGVEGLVVIFVDVMPVVVVLRLLVPIAGELARMSSNVAN